MNSREEYINKSLPNSGDSEKAILGSIILDQNKILDVMDRVNASDFYSPFHRRVYKAMLSLFNASKTIEPVALVEELRKGGPFEGGVRPLLNLMDGLPNLVNLDLYIDLVISKSKARSLIQRCNSIVSMAMEDQDNFDDLLDQAEDQILGISDRSHQVEFSTAHELAIESIDTSLARSAQGVTAVGLETGFIDFDTKMQGLKDGDLHILAARPSVGKSMLAQNIAQNVAFRGNKVVVFFSLEMSRSQIGSRLVASEARVDGYRLNIGHLSDDEWNRVYEARDIMANKQLLIEDTPLISPASIKAKLKRIQRDLDRDIDLVVVDYLQLMGGEDRRYRESEVSGISRAMKLMAREFNCPWIVLSQLNRETEKRANHRPNLSDLRESGAIEQDADVVVFIYREDIYIPDPTMHTSIAEVIVSKNRQGALGTTRMHFDGPSYTFSNLAQESNMLEGDF